MARHGHNHRAVVQDKLLGAEEETPRAVSSSSKRMPRWSWHATRCHPRCVLPHSRTFHNGFNSNSGSTFLSDTWLLD